MAAPLDIQLDEVELRRGLELTLELLAQTRQDPPQVAETGRVEPRAVTENRADLLVLPRGELFEHVELLGHEAHADDRAAQKSQGAADVVPRETRDSLRGVCAGELQPELGGLVGDLEEELVAMHPLVGALLQREQGVGTQVALVVGAALAVEHGTVQVHITRRSPDP